MPVYDLSAVAHATDLDLKQLDNLLSRNSVPGVTKNRRGIARRLTPDIAVVVRLAKELAEGLGAPAGSMLPLASNLERGTDDEIRLGPYVTLRVDRAALRASTLARLDSAVEVVGRRPRGRPPKRTGAG